jgi:hypothetical protein
VAAAQAYLFLANASSKTAPSTHSATSGRSACLWEPATDLSGARRSRPSNGFIAKIRQQRMEPLWSPVVATGSNQRQINFALKRRKQAKSFAAGCDGKEGVIGSSPIEGFTKFLQISSFC